MASEASGSAEEVVGMVTVIVAVPVTTVPSGLLAMAVMTVVPAPVDVATPVAELMVATAGLLDFHVAVPVELTVVPVPVVPMATKLAV